MGWFKPDLAKGIEGGFEAVYAALKAYETNKWPGFALHTDLSDADIRKLTRVIEMLSKNLSFVPAQIVKREAEQG